MLMMVYYPFRLEACIELFGGRRYVPLAAQRQFVNSYWNKALDFECITTRAKE